MSFTVLLIIAGGTAFGIGYLMNHIPLYAEFGKRQFSPRLMVCRFLAPADVFVTLFLICGSWVGIGTAIMGISMIVYNVLTGIGFSVAVITIKKFFVPRWQKQFETLCSQRMEKLC